MCIPLSAFITGYFHSRQSVPLSTSGLKCCVVANIGCRKINKLYEGLITTNPLKSNLRRHIAACLHLMWFCFRGGEDVMKWEWVCIRFVGSRSLSVVPVGRCLISVHARLSHWTESIPTEGKVTQHRDSSKSSQMKSQGSRYTSMQHFNAREQKILNNHCVQTAVFLQRFAWIELCVLSEPSATAPLGAR